MFSYLFVFVVLLKFQHFIWSYFSVNNYKYMYMYVYITVLEMSRWRFDVGQSTVYIEPDQTAHMCILAWLYTGDNYGLLSLSVPTE